MILLIYTAHMVKCFEWHGTRCVIILPIANTMIVTFIVIIYCKLARFSFIWCRDQNGIPMIITLSLELMSFMALLFVAFWLDLCNIYVGQWIRFLEYTILINPSCWSITSFEKRSPGYTVHIHLLWGSDNWTPQPHLNPNCILGCVSRSWSFRLMRTLAFSLNVLCGEHTFTRHVLVHDVPLCVCYIVIA